MSTTVFFGLYFSETISLNIDIITTVFEILRHVISVLMERILYDTLVDLSNFDFQSGSLVTVFLKHDILEIFSPH